MIKSVALDLFLSVLIRLYFLEHSFQELLCVMAQQIKNRCKLRISSE